jgi:hypothetical protein
MMGASFRPRAAERGRARSPDGIADPAEPMRRCCQDGLVTRICDLKTVWQRVVCDRRRQRRTYGASTNPRHRQQLASRVYHGHPHYERGILEPTIESELIHTEGTRTSRACGVLSGTNIDRFEPLIPASTR